MVVGDESRTTLVARRRWMPTPGARSAVGQDATPANGRTVPFPGQVIPGFSGMIDNGDGTFTAMPDNGFGTKANSTDFLLRLYQITPDWETDDSGSGEIAVGDFISLRDPDGVLPFPIVNEAKPDRLLTGGDFDIESVVRMPDGSFWIGEEFGPFLLHVDTTGKVLAPPVEFPDGKSPANPFLQPGETPLIRSSRGFEAMASSRDGRLLYPIVEGSFVDDPIARRRFIYEFDTHTEQYTGRTWEYETDTDNIVIGDAFMVGNKRLLLIERDDFEGPASVTKRIYEIELHRTDEAGFVRKELVIDLLKFANPDLIGTEASPAAFGVGDPFSFPLQSVEVVVQLDDKRLLIGNDNNYPGSNGRVPGSPDDTEMIVIDLGRRQQAGWTRRVVIGHRGASGYRPEHTLAAYERPSCSAPTSSSPISSHQGRRARRPPRERDRRHHRRRLASGVRRPADDEDDRRRRHHRLVHRGLHARRAAHAAGDRAIPATRPANTAFNGRYRVPTFEEVVDLARHSRTCDGAPVGVYPETKHPTYFDSIGLSLEEGVVEVLESNGFRGRPAPAYIQSFETGNLRDLDEMTDVRLVQLINCTGAPYDLVASGDPRTYADLATRGGLDEIAEYADGVGLCKDVMIPRDAAGNLTTPTPVIRDAHREDLRGARLDVPPGKPVPAGSVPLERRSGWHRRRRR